MGAVVNLSQPQVNSFAKLYNALKMSCHQASDGGLTNAEIVGAIEYVKHVVLHEITSELPHPDD